MLLSLSEVSRRPPSSSKPIEVIELWIDGLPGIVLGSRLKSYFWSVYFHYVSGEVGTLVGRYREITSESLATVEVLDWTPLVGRLAGIPPGVGESIVMGVETILVVY